ncbi:MAG: OmpA-OmpF porin, family [Myxococcales bacterium]|nr:OmpA-OmpF porin, family [Myxococcales bacterium]
MRSVPSHLRFARSPRFFAFGATSALVMSLAAGASAQQTGFAVDRFEPSERGSQFFVVDNLDLRGAARPALGAVLDYSYKPLVVYDANGNERSAIVRHQTFVHLGGSLVLADRLRLGLNVPVAVYQDGDPSSLNGVAYKPATEPAIGDIRLAADLRLVGEKTDPFTLAFGVRAWLPTGPSEQFAGDGAFRIAPQLLAAGDLGVLTYAARLALVYRAHDPAFGGTELGSEMVGAIGAGVKTLDGRFVFGPEVFASSVFTGTDTFLKTRSTPVEGLIGLHYDVTRDVRVGAGAGTGLTRGFGSPLFRGLLSLEYAPAYEKPDRDRDGVYDDEDACPDTAGVRTSDPKTNGCPPPPPDRDGDGIIDSEDACPDVPGVKTNDPKTNGCPPPPSDRDGDGIPDVVDACPDVPGVKSDDPKLNGCPPDRDHDGVLDKDDACPDVPGIKTEDPKTNGCPDTDRDKDGIPNDVDACPDQAGPKSDDPKTTGCPRVFIKNGLIQILEQPKFDFNKANIKKESDSLLTEVAKVMTEHPEIKKVRVEGHTDNVGSADYNKKLSQQRADAVIKWLSSHGIAADRLKAVGMGKERELVPNTSDLNRALNRRVEFHIEEQQETVKEVVKTPGGDVVKQPTPAPAPTPAPPAPKP